MRSSLSDLRSGGERATSKVMGWAMADEATSMPTPGSRRMPVIVVVVAVAPVALVVVVAVVLATIASMSAVTTTDPATLMAVAPSTTIGRVITLAAPLMAFHAMIGRGGRMTRRSGGSVRSHSSKLLERPDVSDYARSDADRVRSYFAWKTKTDDRTRWWWPGPDAVVSNDASDVASGYRSWRRSSGMTGHAGGRCDRTWW
jgi:hypothetical protein